MEGGIKCYHIAALVPQLPGERELATEWKSEFIPRNTCEDHRNLLSGITAEFLLLRFFPSVTAACRALEACQALDRQQQQQATSSTSSTGTCNNPAAAATPGPSSTIMPLVDLWLRCLPLPGEAQGFFAPLPHAAAARLRAARCIPTEGGGCCVHYKLQANLTVRAVQRCCACIFHCDEPANNRHSFSLLVTIDMSRPPSAHFCPPPLPPLRRVGHSG
jgi:hypothetical protein